MSGIENLPDRKLRILANMGVQVWFPRGVRSATKGSSEDPIQADPTQKDQAGQNRAKAAAPTHQTQPSPAQAVVDRVATTKASADSPEPRQERAAAPEFNEPVPRSYVPILFEWFSHPDGLLLSSAKNKLTEQVCRDVMTFVAWRSGTSQQSSQGVFQWPQLESSKGSPQRPLEVFFNKQPGARHLLIVEAEVYKQLHDWLPGELTCIQVESVMQLATDVEAKRRLWQTLAE